MFEDKTHNNIMIDLLETVGKDMNKAEGTLINHALAGAATEFEKTYIELGIIDKNGYAETADREHLILRGKEKGILPLAETKAVWKAVFNVEVKLNSRFSAGELTYICTEKTGDGTYRLMCEAAGTIGNTKQGELIPIEFISGYEKGELTELLMPARDDEETEDYRTRYMSMAGAVQAFGGNRAQYKKIMYGIEGIGACKIYRAVQGERRIKIYFLNALYKPPNESLVADVQEIIDPIGRQGEGEGEAAMYHVVDVYACRADIVDIDTDITIGAGYTWESLAEKVNQKIDEYFLELAKTWENEKFITVRILRVNSAVASVEGIIDVQDTRLNGRDENLILETNSIPVRGEIKCRK